MGFESQNGLVEQNSLVIFFKNLKPPSPRIKSELRTLSSRDVSHPLLALLPTSDVPSSLPVYAPESL